MELLICYSDGSHFVMSNGVRPKFTAIGQQEAAPPESGQLPARAFENKTVFLTGHGTPTDGGWMSMDLFYSRHQRLGVASGVD